MTQQKQDSKVPRKEKWAFFIVNVANIPIMTLIGYFLLIFYTDVAGLPPAVIGTLFLISKIFDGINDPIMGYIIDHLPKTKLGRFRSYLIIGAVLCSLNYALMWLGPSLANNMTIKIVIAYVAYLTFGFTFDLMDIPLNSMIPVMSDLDNDRNTLSNIKGAGYVIGAIIFAGGGLFFVQLFTSERVGYHTLIVFASAFTLIFSIIGTMGIRERIEPVKKQKYSMRDIFKIIGAKPVLILFLDMLISGIGAGIGGAVGIYFFEYALGRPELFTYTALSLIGGVLIGVLIAPSIIKRVGKKRAKFLSALPGLISAIILFFTPTYNAITFVIIPLYTSWGTGISQLLSYNIQADNMDFIEWKHGFRAEGAVASLTSFIVKASGGLGTAIAAYALGFIGYIPNQVQSSFTIQGFYWLSYAIPAFFTVISLLIWSFYPLTEGIRQQMMKDLIEQRNAYRISTNDES